MCRSISIQKATNHTHVAVGKMDGTLEIVKSVLDISTVIHSSKIADRPILYLEYSPDCKYLALGAGRSVIILETVTQIKYF